MYHYLPGAPYTATIGGTSTSSYLNPNTFAIGENQPGAELSGIKKTAATDGYFRYSFSALATNSFSGPLGGCASRHHLRNGREERELLRPHHAIVRRVRHRDGTADRSLRCLRHGTDVGQPDLSDLPGCSRERATVQSVGSRCQLDVEWGMEPVRRLDVGQRQQELFLSQGIADAQNASWNGAFVELDYSPALLPLFDMPDWFFAYRYDLIRNNRQGDPTFAKNYNNVDSHTLLVRYFIHHSTELIWPCMPSTTVTARPEWSSQWRRSPRSDDVGRIRFCVLNEPVEAQW